MGLLWLPGASRLYELIIPNCADSFNTGKGSFLCRDLAWSSSFLSHLSLYSFFLLKRSPICWELHILFFISNAELCTTEMQEFTGDLHLSVHFLVTTMYIMYNTYRADGSWKGSRKWMELEGECLVEYIMMMVLRGRRAQLPRQGV